MSNFRRAWWDFRDVYRLVVERGKSRFLLTMGITAVQWSCRYSVVSALAAFLGADVDPLAVLDAARAAGPVHDFGLDLPTLSELFLTAAGERAPAEAAP